jgi:hypothetical protein
MVRDGSCVQSLYLLPRKERPARCRWTTSPNDARLNNQWALHLCHCDFLRPRKVVRGLRGVSCAGNSSFDKLVARR